MKIPFLVALLGSSAARAVQSDETPEPFQVFDFLASTDAYLRAMSVYEPRIPGGPGFRARNMHTNYYCHDT